MSLLLTTGCFSSRKNMYNLSQNGAILEKELWLSLSNGGTYVVKIKFFGYWFNQG
jgi:hypothetical protein